MITVLLSGRTGNNLFQYAVGRALASRLGTDLVLDASWMNPDLVAQGREMFRFPLRADFKRSLPGIKRLTRKALKLEPSFWHRGMYHSEDSSQFDAKVLQLGNGAMLNGYFQCEGYFKDFEEEIRRDLAPDAIRIPESSLAYRDQLRNSPSVSLHVRRGDYLGIPGTQCVDDGYHDRAILYLKERFPDLMFCVFSDDIAWCRTRFHGSEFLFSDFPAMHADPLHDLVLMASCSHHIIMNSSYSWWGAWLNPNQNKTAIAPASWMQGMSSSGVVPESWIRI